MIIINIAHIFGRNTSKKDFMKKILSRLLMRRQRKENILVEGKYERDVLVTHAREQFIKLAKKGLSIPIFTL
jgi:hypothetical protein